MTPAVDAPASTRRARVRTETRAEILRVAGAQMAADGAAALSLRAVARELGMGVASLYRYFASRDDLLTALLVAAFDAQADAVEAAAAGPDDPERAIRAALHGYRTWSLAHPAEFALAYGTPVPGYAAPAEQTVRAGVRVGDFLARQLGDAWGSGQLMPGPTQERGAALGARERADFESLIERRQYVIPPGLMSLASELLISVHGFVVMEVFGQLRPLLSEPADAFNRIVDRALLVVGFPSDGQGA